MTDAVDQKCKKKTNYMVVQTRVGRLFSLWILPVKKLNNGNSVLNLHRIFTTRPHLVIRGGCSTRLCSSDRVVGL